ncbi:MAG: hypothetical protein MJ096_04270 [Clostridia bacterium]|nr:hypothetical protein [Clostridia bacterium]
MAKKFPIGTWVYHPIDEFTSEEVDIWANCGLTYTMSPKISFGKNKPEELIPFLDRAEELGLKLVANYEGLGNGDYEENFRSVYNVVKGHPALAGFFVADEPSTPEAIEKYTGYMAIQKKVAPELEPYLNLMGSTHERSDLFEGMTYGEFIKEIADKTKCNSVCFDAYTQMINDVGINGFFIDVKAQVEAAEYAGVEPWLTPLCTAHFSYRQPNEYEIGWQINVAAAVGIRGLMWFRYYDRDLSVNNHGSPIDRYHNLTDHYYMMLRCQKIFGDEYGELLMKLKRKKTYRFGKQFADYEMFTDDSHDLIKIEGYLDSIVSFFEDENGTEYMAFVNASMVEPSRWKVTYDAEKCSVTELNFNGKRETPLAPCIGEWDGVYLYPGQLSIFRIDRK